MDIDFKYFIKVSKEAYKRIGTVKCPALNNEEIIFNQKGFRHLIMKSGKYRTKKEQIRRLNLLNDVIEVITKSQKINSYRFSFGIEFWSISKIINNVPVVVVIRQDGKDKPKYFLSVINKNKIRKSPARGL